MVVAVVNCGYVFVDLRLRWTFLDLDTRNRSRYLAGLVGASCDD